MAFRVSRLFTRTRILDIIAIAAATLARSVPEPRRFALLAGIAARTVWVSRLLGLPRTNWVDGAAEFTLYWFLKRATVAGLRFTIPIERGGGEDLASLVGGKAGLLAISVHSPLNYIFPRILADIAAAPLVVATEARGRLLGTAIPARFIGADGHMLRRIRRALLVGETVCAMIDRATPERRTIPVDLHGRTIWVADPAVRLALAAGSEILFVHPSLNAEGGVRIAWSRARNRQDPLRIMEEFARFLSREVRETGTSRPAPHGTADMAMRRDDRRIATT